MIIKTMPVPRTPVVSFCRLSMSKPLAALSLFLIRFIPFQLVILFVRISLEYCLTTLQHGIFDSTHSTFTDCLSLQFSVSRVYSSAPDCTLFFPCLSFHPFPFYQLTDWTACRYYLSLEESLKLNEYHLRFHVSFSIVSFSIQFSSNLACKCLPRLAQTTLDSGL